MKKSILFILFSFSFFISKSQTLSSPESVEWDEANTRWLVGNNGNGTILARSESGTLTAFASGLPSGPYGIEIMGDKVFACSGGFIRGYNLSDGINVFNLNLSGSFLNGLTTDGINFLYATDFSAKKIFKIDVANNSFTTIATGLVKQPNGIIYEGENNRCVFVNWGSNAPIMAIDLTTNAVTTLLATTLSNCDGITKDSSGNYYETACGNNKLNKFNPQLTGTFTVVPGTLSSPADIDTKFGATSDIIGIPGGGSLSFPVISRPNPVIVQNGNQLSTTTTFANYQWYLDAQVIMGANQQTYTALVNGTYACFVNEGNCNISSNEFLISNLSNSVFEGSENNISLYPNPVKDFISVAIKKNAPYEYQITNSLGQVVLKGISNLKIDVKDLQSGSYFILIEAKGLKEIRKFLKE